MNAACRGADITPTVAAVAAAPATATLAPSAALAAATPVPTSSTPRYREYADIVDIKLFIICCYGCNALFPPVSPCYLKLTTLPHSHTTTV